MITLCHAVTGGSGTTLVATSLALESPGPTLLVDLRGDVPAMLGIAEPDRPGALDWLSSSAPIEHLDDLVVEVAASSELLGSTSRAPTAVPACCAPGVAPERWAAFVDWLESWAHHSGGSVVVDAGTLALPEAVASRFAHRWLVTRACYLSLRRATRLGARPTGIVLVVEPGRALRRRDVETAVGAPVVASIDWDPRLARSVDAGLLLCGRRPRVLGRSVVDAGSPRSVR